MEIIITAVLAFIVGWQISKLVQGYITAQLLEELGITVEQLEKLRARLSGEEAAPTEGLQLEEIEVKIEKHNDQLYAFRVDNDQFLGQGNSREALLTRIAESLNDVKLIIREENGADFLKVKAE